MAVRIARSRPTRGGDVRRVLFGRKDDWQYDILRSLEGTVFEGEFGDLRLADLGAYDLVVPLMLSDYPTLHEERDVVEGRALFPEAETVALCHDKALFNRRVAKSGLESLIPTVFSSVPSRFPFILKCAQDAFGKHSHIIESQDDVARFGALIANDGYFMQDYIEGSSERSTHILIKNGKIRYFLNMIFDMDTPLFVRGHRYATRAAHMDRDTRHLGLFESVLDAIGFRDGTCCFDYKCGADGVKIFELNPRYGGSLTWDLVGYLRAYDDAVRLDE